MIAIEGIIGSNDLGPMRVERDDEDGAFIANSGEPVGAEHGSILRSIRVKIHPTVREQPHDVGLRRPSNGAAHVGLPSLCRNVARGLSITPEVVCMRGHGRDILLHEGETSP